MFAFVFAHIDELGRFFDCTKRRFNRGFRIPDERHHRPICAYPRIDIEQRNAVH
jgi:hypothetical protein